MAFSTRTMTLVTLVAGLTYVSFRADPVPVDFATVSRGPLNTTIYADGLTRVRDLFEVASPIAGSAMRSPLEERNIFRAGQTIVAIVRPPTSTPLDPRTQRRAKAVLQKALAARHVAKADLKQAHETQEFAQSQFDRTKAPIECNVIWITRLDDDSQRPAVANSPTDGVMLSVAAINESPVTIGAPLVSITEPAGLELGAAIQSNDALRLCPGALAYIERWGEDTVLEARLDRIAPKARTEVSALGLDVQRVDAYLNLAHRSRERSNLADRYSVLLRMAEWRIGDALQNPLSAAIRIGADWSVFLERNSVAARRVITSGRRSDRRAEVLSGLDLVERVVIHPNSAIGSAKTLRERFAL